MKPTGFVVCALLLPSMLWAGDLQIAVDRKRSDLAVGKPGDITEGSGQYHYDVAISNTSFKPVPALNARYMIFIQRQELGKKPGVDTVEKVKGMADLPAIDPHGTASFSTSELTLREQTLAGGFFYANGGRTKAKDSVVGVWVKVFEGAKQVGEYVNPASASKKNKWEE